MTTERFSVPADPAEIAGLFRILQDVSAADAAASHATASELKEKGLMWVVIRYELTLSRALRPGEDILLSTWVSWMRHKMFRRAYLLTDAGNRPLGRGAGIWAIVDRETRAMVDAAERGVAFRIVQTDQEPPRPAAPEKLPAEAERVFTVPEEWLDSNGHMNNTRYFDVARACIGGEAEGLTLRNIRAAYLNEALLGDRLSVSYARRGNLWAFEGKKNGEPCFQISLEYES